MSKGVEDGDDECLRTMPPGKSLQTGARAES
jgi:hypothetical protein